VTQGAVALEAAMEKIICTPVHHRGKACIGLYFAYNPQLQAILKQADFVHWSQSKKCWYIADEKDSIIPLKKLLAGSAELSFSQSENRAHTVIVEKRSGREMPPAQISSKANNSLKPAISAENQEAFKLYHQQLILKGYSPSTIRTYENEFRQFLQNIKKVSASTFTVNRLKNYLQYCYETLNLAENTLHSRINALKFYYEKVLHRENFFWEIPRPKKPLQMPKLLNEDELRKLFNALINRKHKAMLFTAYSAGLRVSEVVNLKIADIDSQRMQIFIERAKGKKDRYVNLSPVLLDILRKYLLDYKPRPKLYLFESEQTLSAYPTRTAQQIFANAKSKAGIRKEVGIHSLRHSFATHLLDKGTDIKYIKDLLGHFNIKTTERYLHVSKKQLINIVSPLDDLWLKQKIEW